MNQSIMDVGYADLQRAAISPDALGRMIMQSNQSLQNEDSGSTEIGLLAMLVKNNKVANCRYTAYPFSTFMVNSLIQILPENLNRKMLIVQFTTGNDTRILFEQGPNEKQFLSQDQYNAMIPRSLEVQSISASNTPGFLVLSPTPTQPISILGNDLFNEVSGVIIEGS